MTLDTSTLRVAFAIVSLTLLLLFYFITFRRTRAAYSGWWCLALTLFLTGSAAYLLNGTVHQVWANPLGNVVLVAGSASVWAGARSLRTAVPGIWYLAAGPAAAAVASVLDHPATNNWAGGAVFLALMGILIGLSSRELFLLDHSYSRVHRPLAVGTCILAAYYLGRLVAFVMEGRDGRVFTSIFGSAATTIVSSVLLVVASFSMAELSYEQQTQDLRARATVDGLTGLLNRTAFMDLAAGRAAQAQPGQDHGHADPGRSGPFQVDQRPVRALRRGHRAAGLRRRLHGRGAFHGPRGPVRRGGIHPAPARSAARTRQRNRRGHQPAAPVTTSPRWSPGCPP